MKLRFYEFSADTVHAPFILRGSDLPQSPWPEFPLLTAFGGLAWLLSARWQFLHVHGAVHVVANMLWASLAFRTPYIHVSDVESV